MRRSEPQSGPGVHLQDHAESSQLEDNPVKLTVPPALVGFLLVLAVTLASVFYIAAQLVHTP